MGLDRLLAAVAAFFVALGAVAGAAMAAQTGPALSATRAVGYLPSLSSSGPTLVNSTLDDAAHAWTTAISPALSIAFRNTQPVAVSYRIAPAGGADADTASTSGLILSGSTVRITVHLAATNRASLTFTFSALDDRSLAVNFLARVFGPSTNVEGYLNELQAGPGALLRDVLRLALTDALRKSLPSADLAARIRTLTARFAATPKNRAWVLRLLGRTHGTLADWPRNMGAAAGAYAGLAQSESASDQTVIVRARRQADGTGGSSGAGGGTRAAGSVPKILRIDGTSYAVPSQGVATLTFQDAECDVVGGTWFGSDGTSHDFGNGSQQPVAGATPYSCSAGVGQFTPFTVTCGGPGQWTEAVVIRDAAGHTSARYEFQHICTGPTPMPTVTAVVVSLTTGVTPTSITPGDQLRCDVTGSVTSITYTWRRYVYTAPSSYSFSAIPGAVSNVYTVSAADVISGSSTFIGCSVNYSFASGNNTGGGGIATAGIPVRPG